MKRREEITNNIGYQMTHAAIEYIQAHEYADRIDSFEAGAEWADNTMIEKAAQWLYDHLTSEYQGAVLKIVAKDKGKMPVEFVEEFKKAMME